MSKTELLIFFPPKPFFIFCLNPPPGFLGSKLRSDPVFLFYLIHLLATPRHGPNPTASLLLHCHPGPAAFLLLRHFKFIPDSRPTQVLFPLCGTFWS